MRFLLGLLFFFLFLPTAQAVDIFMQTSGAKVVLPSASRAVTTTSSITISPAMKCGHVIVNVTAFTAGALTPHIQDYDPASNTYYDVLVGPAIASTGKTVLKVCPGITPIANGAAADFLTTNWQIQMVAGTADAITYSVGMEVSP